ncbi:flagellar biosynthesis protein FlhF [Streptohalobacillus salinus]|uniref:Flagellar biosynthesis protein FlhF n=1 Tax=Streptohalobacillus salinus TaxID=621096 RepID=A0A2V3WDC4_9BACI|nr:flagellar biosynthesis protein FlhF [Streptohalobacillus salinus]PXW92513.1 flagellar biosynthesis protein FlhF [Streptohalobacillus salinus]
MKVKKFMAPTMPEVMNKVRKDLGSDAVILNSKVVFTGGFLGLFKKRNVEVVAALETDQSLKRQQPAPKANPSDDKLSQLKTYIKDETNQPEKEQQIVLEELRALRKMMEDKTDERASFSPAYETLYRELLEQDIDEAFLYDWLKQIEEEKSDQDLMYQEVKAIVRERLTTLFAQTKSGEMAFEKRFVHLVGPTGVGKTTTIAKLAAHALLNDKKKVALITTDTYRIAAIEQLKTYAKILDIPLEIAYTIEDYQKARLKFQQYDLVFVDTAGRNFRDPKYVEDLSRVVDLNTDIETYLVLSLTAKNKDLLQIYQQFTAIPLKGFIFTKKDETDTSGAIVQLVANAQIGVSYITTGQDVPDDITSAAPDYLASLVMGSTHDES